MGWAHHCVNGLMGWVGASYGSVSKQARVSKPDSRIENRRAKFQKCRGGGMTTYPYIYIYIYICIYMYFDRYVNVHVFDLYISICIYIYTYIYTHTHTLHTLFLGAP